MSGAAAGDIDSTGASPRKIKGRFWPMATARSAGGVNRRRKRSQRAVQPAVRRAEGWVKPFSRTFCPSKWDRSR